MKHTKLTAIGTLLLLGTGAASAQSLGDYAREARKNKTETTSASHHYDNDNLPTDADLSVVGPPPASDDKIPPDADKAKSPEAGKASGVDPAAAAADRQKASDEMQRKLAKQKEKIDWLSHDLDLEQREYRLRAAAFYSDAGDRLRNSAQWDKDEAQFKSDVDSKQKALEAARQELDELQEQARKAGIQEKEQTSDKASSKTNEDSGNDKNKDKDKDQNKDQNQNQNKDKQ